MKKLLIIASIGMLLSGCCTVETTSPGLMDKFDVAGAGGRATQTVIIRNSGWTLLYFIPGLFGDVTWEPEANDGKGDINGGLWLFSDKCNISDCYETLQKLAEQRNCDLSDVVLTDNSMVSLGFTGYSELLGCFVESNDVLVSGVLRERTNKK